MKNLYRLLFLIYSPLLLILIILSMITLVIGDIMSRICLTLSRFIDFNTKIVIKLFLKN